MNIQLMVHEWMQACFGPDDTASVEQRAWRFIEEANELGQAAGVTRDHAHQLVDYVYGREVGEPPQEIGGVMVTLHGLATALDIDVEHAAWQEIIRCWALLPKIQAKNAAKKANSALPGDDRMLVARAEQMQDVLQREDTPPTCPRCQQAMQRQLSVMGDDTWACPPCDEKRRQPDAWGLYLDDMDNNPHRAGSWQFVPRRLQLVYLERVRMRECATGGA